MKYVGPILGAASVRVSVDGVQPAKGVLQRDVIAHLTDRYMFHLSSPSGPGVPIAPALTFQSGVVDPAGERIPVIQLIMLPDGLVAIARNTHCADVALDDFISTLDSQFGYHFGTASIGKAHLSQVSVQFDDAFVRGINSFQSILNTVNETLCPDEQRYRFKRITFGLNADLDLPLGSPMEKIMVKDFFIERRAGQPMEDNAFFCSAPMATTDHQSLLERLEREVVQASAN